MADRRSGTSNTDLGARDLGDHAGDHTGARVRVHRLRVATEVNEAAWLSPEEWARAERFRFQVDRDRFVVGRSALRALAAAQLDIPAADVVLDEGPYGKPSVRAAPPIFVNVSHSGDWVLVAVSRRGEVGIDVELARPDVDVMEIAPTVFTRREMDALVEQGPRERRAMFYRLWTRKEAVLKAWGTGFSLDARDVHVGAEAPTAPVRAPPSARERAYRPVTVRDVPVDDRHMAAVAATFDLTDCIDLRG